MSKINPKLLRPHPKNTDYYSDLTPEKYEEIKRSIETHGIRDPLKVLPDYTILAGHQRLKIALALELQEVPITVMDVSPEEAEYLLIADNEERRQADDDPIKKAKRASFLKEYWGVRKGSFGKRAILEGQNVPLKTLSDVAEAIGEDERTTKRLLKLNDLIPEIQTLVSSGKLGTTAAEQLAYLSPGTQAELHKVLGESITEMTLKEIKDIRAKASEAEKLKKELDAANTRAVEAEEELRGAREELYNIQETLKESINDAYRKAQGEQKEKVSTLEARVVKMQEKIQKLEASKDAAESKVKEMAGKLAEAQKKFDDSTGKISTEAQAKINRMQAEIESLKKQQSEDNKDLKKKIRQLEEEKLALTRAQIKLKDQYVVQDLLSELLQAVGKHMKKAEVEFNKLSNDPVVCDNVYQCSLLLHKAADEMKNWLTMKKKDGVTIDVEAV